MLDCAKHSCARLRSNQHEVVVRHQTSRQFKIDLPSEILDDPHYGVEATSAIVTVRPMESHAKSQKNNDEITLIEPF